MISSYTLIKNEAPFIGAHLEMWLPHLAEMILYEGNSTDGTLEIIEEVIKSHPHGGKIRLFRDKDPKNLREDYTRLFNECLHEVKTDMAIFAHPDMIPVKVPANFDHLELAVAASISMRSFAGEPDGQLFEIKGRTPAWKNIDRIRNPDFGAVYHGPYGAWNEGVYPTAIVGDSRHLHNNLDRYPYEIVDSGIEVLHFSDVRTYERRIGRMRTCLENQGWDKTPAELDEMARSHARVVLKDGDGLEFMPAEYPAEFVTARNKYRQLEKTLVNA